jgi:hypothetical protein
MPEIRFSIRIVDEYGDPPQALFKSVWIEEQEGALKSHLQLWPDSDGWVEGTFHTLIFDYVSVVVTYDNRELDRTTFYDGDSRSYSV